MPKSLLVLTNLTYEENSKTLHQGALTIIYFLVVIFAGIKYSVIKSTIMSMLNFSMPKYSLKTRTYFWNSNGGKTHFRANFVIWSLQLEGVVLINPSMKHTVTSRTVALVVLFLDLNNFVVPQILQK